ncbi:hypothetical protein JCM10213v2_001304 [Rhodosporidiobolus nylandii]
MSTRTRLARKTTTTASYVDPPEYGELDSATEGDDEGGGSGGRRGGQRKGKGKAAREDDEVELSSEEDEKPKKRRRKGKGKARGGKRSEDEGKLEVLTTMPVELLVEIFSHLNPSDLLSLSRVNKTYHTLLASPGSTSLWKKARERFKLPDATAGGGLTEMQYAQLMFGTECQHCGAGKVKTADFFIRQRICSDCRREKFVRLDWLKRTHPDLHPLAGECVIPSYPYGNVDDLSHFSQKLWDLELELEDDATTDSDDEPLTPLPSPSPSPSARPGRSTRRHADGRVNYAESDTEDEKDEVYKPSKAVEKFVAVRKKLREKLREEGQTLFRAESAVHRQLEEERLRAKCFSPAERRRAVERIEDLEERVLDLDLGFTEDDFTSGWYDSKLVISKEPLTDESWEEIKPQVIKLLKRLGKAKVKREATEELQARQSSLRPRYDKLLAALSVKARPFLPLFVDWLALPSVVALWASDIKITDAVWLDSLDAIIEECEEYRLDLVLRAREVILAATTDPDEEEEEDAANEDDDPDVSDGFFRRATSFVACTFRNCGKAYSDKSVPWTQRRYTRDENSVGELVTVLKHQHKLHNFDTHLSKPLTTSIAKDPASAKILFRVHLPLEIVCAVSAILELAEVDATAGRKELKKADDGGHWEWANSTTHKRFAWRTEGALGLASLSLPTPLPSLTSHLLPDVLVQLHLIKRETDKANKLKPPKSLEPPEIVYHPLPDNHWSLLYSTFPHPSGDEEDDVKPALSSGRALGVGPIPWTAPLQFVLSNSFGSEDSWDEKEESEVEDSSEEEPAPEEGGEKAAQEGEGREGEGQKFEGEKAGEVHENGE